MIVLQYPIHSCVFEALRSMQWTSHKCLLLARLHSRNLLLRPKVFAAKFVITCDPSGWKSLALFTSFCHNFFPLTIPIQLSNRTWWRNDWHLLSRAIRSPLSSNYFAWWWPIHCTVWSDSIHIFFAVTLLCFSILNKEFFDPSVYYLMLHSSSQEWSGNNWKIKNERKSTACLVSFAHLNYVPDVGWSSLGWH